MNWYYLALHEDSNILADLYNAAFHSLAGLQHIAQHSKLVLRLPEPQHWHRRLHLAENIHRIALWASSFFHFGFSRMSFNTASHATCLHAERLALMKLMLLLLVKMQDMSSKSLPAQISSNGR